uniref:Family with sequence similarity 13 member A n=1 Tax=Sinocyclocheilus rhinocerous TaxID=307959 RepID=A0A673FZF1_9TELE
MVQLPMNKPSPATATGGKKIFGVSLLELRDLGLVKDRVPVVVRSMVEYLEKHGLRLEGLFRVNGSVRTVDNLRQRFDGGEEVGLHQDADAFAVASLLKQFLRDLPEALIHPSIHNPLIQLYQGETGDFCKDLRELLLQLPDIHYSLLHYLCHFLSQVEQEQAHNRMTATNLATVFGPNTPAMKIQEALSGAEPCNDVPRLDLSTLTDDSNWAGQCFLFFKFFLNIFVALCLSMHMGEPVPTYSSWQKESMEREEAHLSPHAGGKLIRQLLEEDSDPMVSPRFYAYGDSQQYLDDTEVPPSPPNAHSFVRRRSSSLGSCDDDREELTSAQLSKRIHVLKKKIRRFEEKFEEERKYRPSHGDKAANPEVLRWMNELAKMRKDSKDHKLLKSEEDLTPIPRQRSNTLPKSFGSQLEKKPTETKAPKPPVESTLEAVMNKLQEKRKEAGRPEDIKDMTREQIGAEKVALQKALLYYESIHGRPITKNERQAMKPLYDRYRLIKQILCRASAIPVIGSPSSKHRGPLLQPIIEGVPALFFSDTKEEEDGSDDDKLTMLELLDQLDEDTDGFISPVDELSPSKNTTDMRLSNLHAATMQELVEQLQEAREEKKRIRKNLRDFEDQFFKQNSRNVQKEDRSPLAGEYNEYKHIKAKLRLLEVLISKRDSSKFI